MSSFAFVIHPVDPKRDVARKYPHLARILPARLVHFLARFWPPVCLSHVAGVRSEDTGKEIEGWLVACPFTARQALELPTRTVYNKIIAAGRLAQRLGAQILGLGAFTSVVGDAGMTVARHLDIPVTTGHSLTVAMALEALEEGARCKGIRLESSTVAVIGATGSIGRACAELLAPAVDRLILVGRSESRLAQVRAQVEGARTRQVRTSMQVEEVCEADLVLSATSAADSVIQPEYLKHGAVVCDIALPPDVSPRVKQERSDVLIVAGGLVDVPGEVDFGFDFGLSSGKAYACMAETMVLALDGRYESYSLGKHIRVEQVHEIARLARKHGFRLSAIC
ncbi:MAG: polysaccharide biosynthesis protein [Anaerolineae bacterium]|nr:polysaccharide biosynthesis protein [Anaerolineae bacterium]